MGKRSKESAARRQERRIASTVEVFLRMHYGLVLDPDKSSSVSATAQEVVEYLELVAGTGVNIDSNSNTNTSSSSSASMPWQHGTPESEPTEDIGSKP